MLLIGLEMAIKNGWKSLLDEAAYLGEGVGPTRLLAWPWKLNEARERGLIVHSYTVNRKWEMRLVRFFGADGIHTDYPEVALELYGKSNGPLDVEQFFQQ